MMRDLPAFELERYFARHEFSVTYQLSASDCEPLSPRDLLPPGGGPRLEEFLDSALGYTESAGNPALRQQIATYYETVGTENLLVSAPEEAIFLLMNALLGPGDHVVVMSPAYQSLLALPHALGAAVSEWGVRERDGGWELDPDELRGLLRPETRLIVANLPHNPTGLLPDSETLEAIISVARKHGVHLFSDEMYRGLEYGDAPGATPRPSATAEAAVTDWSAATPWRLPAVCDRYEKGISLWGLSKSFGLPGLRIGWLATQDEELLQRAAALKDYTTICNSAASEWLAQVALDQGEALMRTNRERIGAHAELVAARLAADESPIAFLPGRGGSTILPRFTDGRSSRAFADELRVAADVLLIPGPLFKMPDSYFRLGLGRADFSVAFARFSAQLGLRD
ncbi:MAG: aminotransferase class I/II-fold pyridoxal phosphate-dependent enzyme [Spirochaetes bacterium]|jgi:aspartate/methionine/tyrosine aminotransferase|nr:aminotransferase class I/II-fold pyridoxal phosphate-dependent enzyme [Spirochaetota bacterium]